MDRFIAPYFISTLPKFIYLKSNMDRFIAFGVNSFDISEVLFKIQYG